MTLHYNQLDLLKDKLEDAIQAYNDHIETAKEMYQEYLEDNEDTPVSFEDFIIDDMDTPSMLQDEIDEAKDEVREFENKVSQVEAIIGALDYDSLETSRKTISTYLTFDIDMFDEIAKIATVNVTLNELVDEDEDVFTLRISDHKVGSYRDKNTGELETYEKPTMEIII